MKENSSLSTDKSSDKFIVYRYNLIIYFFKLKLNHKYSYNYYTMNLSKQSGDKELFSGERSSKENTLIKKMINIFVYYINH